jgi:hypothetical protein
MRIRLLVVILCVLIVPALPLRAQQKGQWVPGQYGLNAGVIPDPGFTYMNLALNYSASQLNNSQGNPVRPITGTYSFWVDESVLMYVPNKEILGGYYAPYINLNVAPTGARSVDAGGQVARTGKVWGNGISQNVVWYVVRTCCERVGLEHIAPHDLRRTCANCATTVVVSCSRFSSCWCMHRCRRPSDISAASRTSCCESMIGLTQRFHKARPILLRARFPFRGFIDPFH